MSNKFTVITAGDVSSQIYTHARKMSVFISNYDLFIPTSMIVSREFNIYVCTKECFINLMSTFIYHSERTAV